MTFWLAVPWVAVVFAGAWHWRPAPSRVVGLRSPRRTSVLEATSLPAERLGGWLRRALGRDADGDLDRRLGWSVIAGAVLALIEPALTPLAGGLWLAGRWAVARRARHHADRLVDDSPEVIDLFLLAVDTGCNPRLAVEAVAVWSHGPWRDALQRVTDRVAQGERLSSALERLSRELGDAARPLVVALLDTEYYGVALTPALERLSRERAVERRRRAEERARRVPVQLLFPLVFCTLPAFVLLTVVPLLAGTLPSLSP